MTKRLTPQDWIDFGLKALAREGVHALKADVLARKLGVSRGSFYWHFPELGAFHARVIEHWKERATEAIIAGLERYQTPEQRLDALLRSALTHDAALEVRMRSWADTNSEAAKVLRDIDLRRRTYVERLLVQAGIAPAVAVTRAQLLYWTYLGAALSQTRLVGKELDRTVTELKRTGLGEPLGQATAIVSNGRRRMSRGRGR